MDEEYIVNSTSRRTADINPIVLSEKEKVQTLIEPYWVEGNHKDKPLGINIVYKKTKKEFGNIKTAKLGKREIKAGEYIEFNLDRDETLKLFNELKNLYSLANGRGTPMGEVKYIAVDKNIEQLKLLLNGDNEQLAEVLKQSALSNLNNLSNLVNIAELEKLEAELADNLDNDDEGYWQKLFEEHNLAISQIFIQPFVYFQSKAYYGGKSVENKNGTYGDFTYKNIKTDNIAVVEIKTPKTTLMNSSIYRNNVYAPTESLAGAILQTINEVDTFVKNYFNLSGQSVDKKFSANNVKSILIIGKISSLNDKQKESFDKFRNELRKTEIITFDELRDKILLLIKMLKGIENPINDEVEEDLPF